MKIRLYRLLLLTLLAAGEGASANSLPHAISKADLDIYSKDYVAAVQVTETSIKDRVITISNSEPGKPISLRELLEYLPNPPRGWSAKDPEGETNSFGSYSVSQVSQTYTNKNKKMKVSIFDWAFNSALYMPFLLSTEFSQESTVGYNKGIKIGDMPGREEYNYQSRRGSLNLLVDSRFLVRIDGRNIEDKELREWWSQMDLPF